MLISPFLPWPPHDGARIRILETLRFLSKRHEITFMANVSEAELEYVDMLRKYCCHIEVEVLSGGQMARLGRMIKGLMTGSSFVQSFHFNKKLAKKIFKLSAEQSFDVIQIELSFMARYATAISPLSKARLVLATHNIETQRFLRELKLSSWDARRAVLVAESTFFPNWEVQALHRFDGVIAVSAVDVEWIKRHAKLSAVELVPNGVDTEFFQPSVDSTTAAHSIVFTGLMDYPPNSDAVCWFVREIFPSLRNAYPGLEFKIVGARPSTMVLALEDHDGVEVTGEVPDIRPFVHAATAFVVPLRSGGGTRLKILQAMSMACPVISTAVGAEGLDVSEGENILFAEDTAQFVSKVGMLIDSTELAEQMSKKGRELVVEKYDWKSCLGGEEILYERLLSEAR